MITCTRRLEFDYGHRLMNHESKCAHAHGHRGVIELECSAKGLDRAGRIIDFSEVKAVVGAWLDEYWDHSFIVNAADEPMVKFLVDNKQRRFLFTGEPSAENLASYVLEVARTLLASRGIGVESVRFWETPNGSATAR